MRLVMVTTAQSHWDGLAGNTAMFSEAVVQPMVLDELPNEPVETIFIKKNPDTRRYEKAWWGKSKNFKRVTKQDRDYLTFAVEGLTPFDCPEILRTKTVGCHLLTEFIDSPQEPPKRPIAASIEKKVALKQDIKKPSPAPVTPVIVQEEEKEVVFYNTPVAIDPSVPVYLNGNGKHADIEAVFTTNGIAKPATKPDAPVNIPATDETNAEPGYFRALLSNTNPTSFEQQCYTTLRLLGIHDLHRPTNAAGTDAHGFFKFNTLAVVYTTTLVPVVLQENPLVTDHYLNLLKKEKIRFSSTGYSLKDTQKQVWLITNAVKETELLRTEDGIKLKLIPAQKLLNLYRSRLQEPEMNSDGLWEALKNI